jgi:hypothetical protein
MSNYCVVCKQYKYKDPLCKYSVSGSVQNVCSYGCWCKRDSHLLKYENLINKEDFQDPVPCVKSQKSFNLKTDGELEQMTAMEVELYLRGLDDYMLLNPMRLEIQLKELNNVDNESLDNTSSEDDMFSDDY